MLGRKISFVKSIWLTCKILLRGKVSPNQEGPYKVQIAQKWGVDQIKHMNGKKDPSPLVCM